MSKQNRFTVPWKSCSTFSHTTVRNTMPLQLPCETAVVLPSWMSISLSKWRHRGSHLSIAWNYLWGKSNYTQISSSGQRFFPDPLPLHWHGVSLFPSGMRFRPRDGRLVLRETVKLASPSLYLWKAIYVPLSESTPNVTTGRQTNLEVGGERPASGNTELLFLLCHLLARCLCCGNNIIRVLLPRSCMGSKKLITWSHCLTSGSLQFRRLRQHATLPAEDCYNEILVTSTQRGYFYYQASCPGSSSFFMEPST